MNLLNLITLEPRELLTFNEYPSQLKLTLKPLEIKIFLYQIENIKLISLNVITLSISHCNNKMYEDLFETGKVRLSWYLRVFDDLEICVTDVLIKKINFLEFSDFKNKYCGLSLLIYRLICIGILINVNY